jgi:hypothetical protein
MGVTRQYGSHPAVWESPGSMGVTRQYGSNDQSTQMRQHPRSPGHLPTCRYFVLMYTEPTEGSSLSILCSVSLTGSTLKGEIQDTQCGRCVATVNW